MIFLVTCQGKKGFGLRGRSCDDGLRNCVVRDYGKPRLCKALAKGFRKGGFIRVPKVITDGLYFHCAHAAYIQRLSCLWQWAESESSGGLAALVDN